MSQADSLYQQLRTHLAYLRLGAAAEALPPRVSSVERGGLLPLAHALGRLQGMARVTPRLPRLHRSRDLEIEATRDPRTH